MTPNQRRDLEAIVDRVLGRAFLAPLWHATANRVGGKICVTVSPSPDVLCEVTKHHLTEVERILGEHLPAELDGRWRILDIRVHDPLRPPVVVWLDVVWLDPPDAAIIGRYGTRRRTLAHAHAHMLCWSALPPD